MGRTRINVDKTALVKAIKSIEKNGPVKNRMELYTKVGKILNITSSIACLRIKEYKISPKTQKGRRGFKTGRDTIQKSARTKKLGTTDSKTVLKEWKESIPSYYMTKDRGKSLIKNVEKGSMPAVIKAMCLSCCCYSEHEIRCCNIKTCPLWLYRPFTIKGE